MTLDGTTCDLVVRGAHVRTMNAARPAATAVGVIGDRIAWVGDDADARRATGRGTTVVDAGGRLLMPGFVDSHNHLLLGFDPDAVSLEGAQDLDEVRRRIDAHADARPDLPWVCAENFVYSVVPGRHPSSADLAGVAGGRPVFCTSYDQHSVWLNDAALRALGIDRHSEIAWGTVERDGAGEPTGYVADFYTSAMTPAGLSALARDVPLYSADRRYRRLLSSLDSATRFGITTVVEPQVPLEELPLFERAREEGHLRSRVIVALFHDQGADGERRRRLLEATRRFPADGLWSGNLRLGPLKLYIDDVVEPHTAAMVEDYANRPGQRGRTFYEPTEFALLVAELDRLGFQTHTHATGDLGIRVALDAIEHAQRANGSRDRRHGIVHVECLHPDDLPRFARLGVVPAMQPRHCSPDFTGGAWMENVGEERWGLAWAFRSLAESGAPLAFSSDWQVAEMDPLIGVYSALTRASLDGQTSWVPEQRLDLDTTLAAYTRGGAWAWHAERQIGMLAPGYLADLVLLSDDPYRHEPAALLDMQVDLTVVGGQVVHRSA